MLIDRILQVLEHLLLHSLQVLNVPPKDCHLVTHLCYLVILILPHSHVLELLIEVPGLLQHPLIMSDLLSLTKVISIVFHLVFSPLLLHLIALLPLLLPLCFKLKHRLICPLQFARLFLLSLKP